MRRSSPLLLVVLVAASIIALPLHADAGALYSTKCAPCHGATGKGDTAMGKKLGIRSFSSPEVQQQSDAALLEIISKGKGKMPAFGGRISDPDLKALVAHLRTFAKK